MSRENDGKAAAGALGPDAFGRLLSSVVELNRKFLETLIREWNSGESGLLPASANLFSKARLQAGETLEGQPDRLRLLATFQEAQLNFWQALLEPVRHSPFLSGPLPAPASDPRFRDAEWRNNPRLKKLMEAYLEVSRGYLAMAEAQDMEPGAKRKLKFYLRYILDALAPTNFFLTNPEAIRCFCETGGESLVRGLENLAADLRRGRLTLADESAFRLGENLAATPGEVIYANPVMQLIQYYPRTPVVRARPLFIVPPCINKFYILDLQAHNSFVRACLDRGFQVFLISWVNPDRRHRDLDWDDYVCRGIIEGAETAAKISGGEPVNALGYCIGGTLLGCALAVLKARRRARLVSSATFLTTLFDFSDPGDIGVFVDEQVLACQERAAAERGYIPGQDLFHTFSQVRANDLIWSYVVSNYLKGLDPPPFDILSWNCDPVNLPLPLYRRFIREMYLENRLLAGDLRVCGVRVELGKIKTPAYFLATMDDHLVPWKGCFAGAARYAGAREFVLGRGGHVAGVINPPGKEGSFYRAGGGRPGAGLEAWWSGSEKHPGSWWEHWWRWLKKHSGRPRPAPAAPGGPDCPVIEPAPGSYVTRRLDFSG